jgi:molybdopterin-containing oxidoreductase family iron-sulfur binding subunit
MTELKNIKSKEYWRSLDQLADTPEFRKILEKEFPEGAAEMKNPLTRRNFLSLMGASLALAGLSACRRPVEKIIPYVKAPERMIPGVPHYYATTMPLGTSAYGVVVESHEGRPTKIEGNEHHPSSQGKSNTWMQASVLDLYDPNRSQRPVSNGEERDWNDFVIFWRTLYAEYQKNKGLGLAILCDSFSSPSLSRMKDQFKKQFPTATWTCYAPVSQENVYQGISMASGLPYHPLYHFHQADVILSLDSDFLLTEKENIIHARGFADGRRINSVSDKMNRLYMVESSYSTTGAMADHRLRLPINQVPGFVFLLVDELKKRGVPVIGTDELNLEGEIIADRQWISAVSKDLITNRGKSLVVAGYRQPARVHALVYLINQALGNVGKSVTYRELTDLCESQLHDLLTLTDQMKDGAVKTLIMLGGNPAYNAPADLDFSNALAKVEHTIHLTPSMDETSRKVKWHIPQAHYLESWGDCRSSDGSLSLIQPLIAPLFDSHSMLELLFLINEGSEGIGHEITQQTWKEFLPGSDFDKKWRRVLHDGVLANSQLPTVQPQINKKSLVDHFKNNPIQANTPDENNLEIVFHTSPAIYDGRFANIGWLQELPDSVSKLTWDNAALISQQTANTVGLKNEDLIVLNLQGREMVIPVWILPGLADFSVSVMLGYGRTSAGRVGNGVGFDVYRLRTSQSINFDLGLTIRKTLDRYSLANTQDHSSMEGRPLVREATLAEYRQNPAFAEEMVDHPPLVSLWEEHPYEEGYQWGLTIDLNSCTGCNACTIACQSENNIPIIGKEQVRNGREMHWIRIDRYFSGDIDDPEMVHQPVACHHCEMAPCEQVCPVAATVHDEEGLNLMTYNRCIGTRYCSNNCPYKVRRFNFFNYTNKLPEIVKMVQNPDVTVRSRGVMEKCTYCLQRISAAKINSKNENRDIQDGEIQTACQQACPTNAIVFGNINDPESAVSRAKKNNRKYEMMAELNLKPRTSYLARLRNPNPELVEN